MKAKFKNKNNNIVFKILILISLVFLISIITIYFKLRPLVEKVSSYQCQLMATSVITNCVYSTLSGGDYSYDKLVNISKNINGNVTSVENDMIQINMLHSILTNSINEEFKLLKQQTIDLPLGSLTGIDFLYGRGPDLSFKIDPIGSIQTNLISKFTSVGVNQSQHEIILVVEGDMTAIIPGYTYIVHVQSTYIIASTIIVGDIPDSYTYITGDERDEISKINDYKH